MPHRNLYARMEPLHSFKMLVLDDDRRSDERRSSSDLPTQTTSAKSISKF
jgi:hypothetical protein